MGRANSTESDDKLRTVKRMLLSQQCTTLISLLSTELFNLAFYGIDKLHAAIVVVADAVIVAEYGLQMIRLSFRPWDLMPMSGKI